MGAAKQKEKPWERLNGKWIVGIVKDEGGNLTFESMWDDHEQALKRYRELLKSDDVHCLVFVTKIVASMDKIVRYYFDHDGKHPGEVTGIARQLFGRSYLPKDEYNHVVTQYVRKITEQHEKKEEHVKKWLKAS